MIETILGNDALVVRRLADTASDPRRQADALRHLIENLHRMHRGGSASFALDPVWDELYAKGYIMRAPCRACTPIEIAWPTPVGRAVVSWSRVREARDRLQFLWHRLERAREVFVVIASLVFWAVILFTLLR